MMYTKTSWAKASLTHIITSPLHSSKIHARCISHPILCLYFKSFVWSIQYCMSSTVPLVSSDKKRMTFKFHTFGIGSYITDYTLTWQNNFTHIQKFLWLKVNSPFVHALYSLSQSNFHQDTSNPISVSYPQTC